MSKTIFSVKHNASTLIQVITGRDLNDASKGLDVAINGVVKLRAYNPSEVTAWFQKNSKANVALWQKAYHTSGLTEADFRRPTPVNINLQVPYYSQRDNTRYPNGTCNVTCYAMAMAFAGTKRFLESRFKQREDELEYYLEKQGRDRHLHDDLAWMGREYGLESRFGTNRTLDQIISEVRNGSPVIVSGTFTSSGHIILIRGIEGDDFRVNDPFGNGLKKYRDRDGENLLYPREYMLAKVRKGNAGGRWAHMGLRLAK